MRRHCLGIVILLVLLFPAFSRAAHFSDAERFKMEYESLNDTFQSDDCEKRYRDIQIPSDNPVRYVTAAEAAELLENDTVFLYMGAPWCPWCRHAVPALLEAASAAGIEELYYVDMTDERDRYEIQDDLPVQVSAGMPGYFRLMDVLSDYLPSYTIKINENTTMNLGEKRIMIPFAAVSKDGCLLTAQSLDIPLYEGQSVYGPITQTQHDELTGRIAQMMRLMREQGEPT